MLALRCFDDDVHWRRLGTLSARRVSALKLDLKVIACQQDHTAQCVPGISLPGPLAEHLMPCCAEYIQRKVSASNSLVVEVLNC